MPTGKPRRGQTPPRARNEPTRNPATIPMRLLDGIPGWGSPVDEGAMRQIRTCARTAEAAALMADHHKGYAIPIGVAMAGEDEHDPYKD